MDSMPLALAKTLAKTSPVAVNPRFLRVGGLGRLRTYRLHTVSDLLLAYPVPVGYEQQQALQRVIVAAQAVGSGMGNMIIRNVVAVCAVVGLSGSGRA